MNRIILARNLINNRQWCRIPVLSHEYSQYRHERVPRYVANSSVKMSDMEKFSTSQLPPKYDWNSAISEAERLMGYPTSFLSLRWLLNDEIANIAVHLRKFALSGHPLLETFKNLMYNGNSTFQLWGLIVLLISNAAGHDPLTPDVEQDKSAGILHTQRGLATITEMIRIAHLIHSCVVNLQKSSHAGQDLATYDDLIFGNKIGLLIGDYLLSNTSVELSNLRNQEVMGLISSTIRDFSESEFIGDRDELNNPLPTKPGSPPVRAGDTSSENDFDDSDVLVPLCKDTGIGNAQKDWEVRNILNGGSLLGKSCQAAMKLARHSEEVQKNAYLLGKHLHLAWQASLDAEPFQVSFLSPDTSISLVSAPVLFHLEYDPVLYDEIEKGKVCVDNVDYIKIHKAVVEGPGLDKTKQLQRYHTTAAIRALEKFPSNDARTILESFVLGVRC